MIGDARGCAARNEVARSPHRKCLLYNVVVLLTVLWIQLPMASASERPLSRQDVIALLRGGVFSNRVATLVEARGISFVPTDRDFALLRRTGADDVLLHALERARPTRRSALSASKQPAKPQIPSRPAEGTAVPGRGKQSRCLTAFRMSLGWMLERVACSISPSD
jgi:hypothetical protein